MRFRNRGTTLKAGIFLAILLGLFLVFQIGLDAGEITLIPSTPQERGVVEVYFTMPDDPASRSLRGGPDASLAQAIDEARYSVAVAIYHLDLWSVRDALLRAHNRGVAVRVVVESDHELEPEITALKRAGIEVIGDQRPALMHHKFVVIDALEVWSGSMNFTVNGAYRNHNNLVRIDLAPAAEDYLTEFEEMFVEARFGALSQSNTPYPIVELERATLEILFSPDDEVAQHLVRWIRSAQESLDFMAYTFTSEPIANAILDHAAAGLDVRGVIDASQRNAAGSQFDRLRAGVDGLRWDEGRGLMHHKVILIDQTIVVTGSYNFTRSAENRNDENLLMVVDEVLAREYLLEFERIYDSATQ